MRHDHSIVMLCENPLVSTSGFYDWDRRRSSPGPRAVEDLALADEIAAIHSRSRQTYGAPWIDAELRSDAYSGALDIYGILNATDNAAGIDELRSQMGQRFRRRSRGEDAPTPTPAPAN